MCLDFAHGEVVAQAAPSINLAPDVAPQIRPRWLTPCSTKLPSVTCWAGARAMHKNMKSPKSSAPSTSWMKNGSVPETVTGCPVLVFATKPQPATHKSAPWPSEAEPSLQMTPVNRLRSPVRRASLGTVFPGGRPLRAGSNARDANDSCPKRARLSCRVKRAHHVARLAVMHFRASEVPVNQAAFFAATECTQR